MLVNCVAFSIDVFNIRIQQMGAMKQCRRHGCLVLIPVDGPAYCVDHVKAERVQQWQRADAVRQQSPELMAAARFRSSTEWQRVRRLVLAQHPQCCDPFAVHRGMWEPAQDVHHVEPLARRPDLGLSLDNLRPLCRRCHNRVESMERNSIETKSLFSREKNSKGAGVG